MNALAFVLPLITALLTFCGLGYSVLVLWGAASFRRLAMAQKASAIAAPLPGVSILKPLRGVDAHMYAGFVSHCQQTYTGPYELLFAVSSLDDPAVAEVTRLRVEYPNVSIQLVHCTERLGTNGKLSSLTQMLPHARYEHVIVNDSDILVSPQYLVRVMSAFADQGSTRTGSGEARRRVGLVTVPYVGHAERTFFSIIEALGISTDFIPGVLAARSLEGGLRFGLGSTLATTKSALVSIGGFDVLVDQLADDYELGERLHHAGYRVELVPEVVGTAVGAYTFRGFFDHQLRWARSTRDSRRLGYLGLAFTYVLPWAILTVLASGLALWSISLLSLALLARVLVALTVGVGLLGDGQVLRYILLLPIRDFFGLFFWAWSYAGDVVVWRGERFRLRRGSLEPV